jgi:hypothetical protein
MPVVLDCQQFDTLRPDPPFELADMLLKFCDWRLSPFDHEDLKRQTHELIELQNIGLFGVEVEVHLLETCFQ